jgi:Fur family transcriptional regulator, peroxide stress response regulator
MQIEAAQEQYEYFKTRCREHHLKVTPQRFSIYRKLVESRMHPSADTMYQAIRQEFPNISHDTVNRTLITFADIGLVDVVEGHGDPRRFDSNVQPHHHFHCKTCGTIYDFEYAAYDNLEIPENIQKDFSIHGKRMVLSGICNKCR